MDDLTSVAEARFAAALEKQGARDPREFYRERLRTLRSSNPTGFQQAIEYYETRLIPEVAGAESDPLESWLEYGRVLASISAPGETVQIDPSGKSSPYSRPVPGDHLVLHLPTSRREPALAVGLPPALSPAQRATYELLVARKTG